MKYYYDLHIHSALSPCGDNDMTPNNIINMALLKGLDIIAVTDHNAAGNIRPLAELGKQRQIIVIPGMEIESAEEVHILSLFPDIDTAEHVQDVIRTSLPGIPCREDIFGEQRLMNINDEVTGHREDLLITASSYSTEAIFQLVREAGGIPVPAHIDRSSYSVLSNLGEIPEDLSAVYIELSASCDADAFLNDHPELKGYPMLRNSDAHYLWDMSERVHYIRTDTQITDAEGLIALLKDSQREFSIERNS